MAPVTAIYAALLAPILIFLANRVATHRRTRKIGLGDRDDRDLAVLVRVHANFVENVPFTLLLMAFAELNGAPTLGLHASGAALVAARALHAYGFGQAKGNYHHGRFAGTAINWTLNLLLAVANLYLVWVMA